MELSGLGKAIVAYPIFKNRARRQAVSHRCHTTATLATHGARLAASPGGKSIFERLRQRDSLNTAMRGFWAALNLRKRLQTYLTKAGSRTWPKAVASIAGVSGY
jgi:hypothetical protein